MKTKFTPELLENGKATPSTDTLLEDAKNGKLTDEVLDEASGGMIQSSREFVRCPCCGGKILADGMTCEECGRKSTHQLFGSQ